MTSDDERSLDERRPDGRKLIDDLWPALEPPEGFSRRVVAAVAGEAPRDAAPARRRGRPWVVLGAGLGAAVALALVLLWFGRGATATATAGSLVAATRKTLEIGGRATLVAEVGVTLGWSATGRRVRVEQSQGAVFYRVDSGGPFVVVTPAGDVEVTGTCFQVEASAAGAPLETWVRVYEGAVRVRNAKGALSLSAGDGAHLRAASPPELTLDVVPPPSAAARAAAAEARSAALARELAEAKRAAPPGPPAPGEPPRDKFFGFDEAEKRRLAARCEFRYALPRHLATLDLLDGDETFDLPREQRAAVVRIMEEQRNEFLERLRAIYRQIVGETPGLDGLSPLALQNEISIKSRKGDDEEARRHIFDEWAGRAVPPRVVTARPPIEQFWRLVAGGADELVARLAPVVGDARAKEIAGKLIKSAVAVRDEEGCAGAAR